MLLNICSRWIWVSNSAKYHCYCCDSFLALLKKRYCDPFYADTSSFQALMLMKLYMNRHGRVWMRGHYRIGMMQQKSVFSSIGASIQCQLLILNGFGWIGSEALRDMKNSWRQIINQVLPIMILPHHLRLIYLMPMNGLDCSREVVQSKWEKVISFFTLLMAYRCLTNWSYESKFNTFARFFKIIIKIRRSNG